MRETAAQALGAAVQPLGIESLRVLLGQLQTLACSRQWEVRHSGLLALKYVIAARPDSAAQLLPLAVDIATAGLKVQCVLQQITAWCSAKFKLPLTPWAVRCCIHIIRLLLHAGPGR